MIVIGTFVKKSMFNSRIVNHFDNVSAFKPREWVTGTLVKHIL